MSLNKELVVNVGDEVGQTIAIPWSYPLQMRKYHLYELVRKWNYYTQLYGLQLRPAHIYKNYNMLATMITFHGIATKIP